MSSKTYWRDRELEWKKKRLKDEKQYADEIQEIYAKRKSNPFLVAMQIKKTLLWQKLKKEFQT